MKQTLHYVEDDNLSVAWARAFRLVTDPGVIEIMPLTVTVTGFAAGIPVETSGVRGILDSALDRVGCASCHTVANTIFPNSLWNPAAGYAELSRRYNALLPRLKHICPSNRYGVYFERMIGHWSGVSQLEHIIETYKKGNHRRSALQAVIFDPCTDHTDQHMRGFPCLHQVSFTPFGDGELAVTGFYANQWLFAKAYGNYLGLCHLGRFVAHELGLELTRLSCIAGRAVTGEGISKQESAALLYTIQQQTGIVLK